MIDWLERSALFPKFFYKGRDRSYAWGACGAKREYAALPDHTEGRLFGAHAFLPFPSDDPLWKGFSSCYFFLPQEMRQGVVFREKGAPLPSPLSKTYVPSKAQWEEGVVATQACIREGVLEKAVLARVTTFTFDEELNPWDILRMLLASAHNATFFAFQQAPGTLFLGASPERLYQRAGRTLITEAVAGTRPLWTPDEELLTSVKDLHEFGIVKEALTKALIPLSETLQWDAEESLMKTTAVKHLYNALTVTLKGGVSDAQLIASLHPTPAMGGAPTQAAVEWIAEREPFHRGLYAGPIGWLDPLGAEFAVGIRSALVRENRLHLFTGAGIVSASDPILEWEEIETKMGLFTHEFCAAHH